MKIHHQFRRALLFLGMAAAGVSAPAAEKTWTGGTDLFWSTGANWLPTGAPGASDNAIFTNSGVGDGSAANSVVDAGFNSAIQSLVFANIQGFHNVNLTRPLVVGSTATAGLGLTPVDGKPAVLFVGTGAQDGANDAVYTRITGDSLTVNNPNAVISVVQASTTAGAHRATLDLSGLGFFSATVSNVLVGFGHDFNLTNAMRPSGTLILGTSNVITSELILIADAYQNANGQHCFVYLGQNNNLNLERIRIGLHKCPGTMTLNAGLSSPSAVFRDKAGTGRQISWELGDQYETVYTGYFASGAATGILDLTGAQVDALVETIVLGRGQTNAPLRNGDGVGTLTFGGGTIDVNELKLGVQLTGSGTTGRGTLNINNDSGAPGTMRVNNNVLMAAGLPQSTEAGATTLDIAQATINLNGGKLEVAGDIIDGGGNTTINLKLDGVLDLKPGTDATPGNVTVDTMEVGSGTIVNYGTLSVKTMNFSEGQTGFSVAAGSTLAPVAVGTIGNLAVAGDLQLRGTLDIDVYKAGAVLSSDKITATGALDLGGTLKVRVTGDALAVGDKFTILAGASVANSFGSLALQSPGAGLSWSNNTAVDGTIEVIAAPVVTPVEKIWTGSSGDTFWSTAGNWLPVGAPGASDNVTFTNLGFAELKLSEGGSLSSVVDAGFSGTINSLGFHGIQGFQNVNLAKPLVVESTSTTDVAYIAPDTMPAVLFVGSGVQDAAADAVYTTIAGDSLTVNNPNAVISVMQASTAAGAHRATLDMSGLNFFTATVSNILVGYAHDFGLTNVMRPSGTVILGVSNTITTELIAVADAYQNANNQVCFFYLGQNNQMNVDRIRLGLHKAPGTMAMNAGLTAPSAVFRNKAGTGRQIAWELGDQYETVYTGYFASGAATGILDLTGAQVDAMVETIVLGRGQTNAPLRNGDGVGTLTFGGGTIDVNDLKLGVQLTGSGTTGRGTLNINNDAGTPGTMRVNNNVLMAAGLPQSAEAGATTLDIAQATINLNGGKLEVAGDIIDGGGNSTINLKLDGVLDLKPGTDATPGNVTVDTIEIGSGMIVNYGTLSVKTINFSEGQTGFSVAASATLAPVAVGSVGNLAVAGDLQLRGTLDIDVNKIGAVLTSDTITATGALDLGGTLKVRVTGDALAAGDKFSILAGASTVNAFETLVLSSPGDGLSWTNKTAIDGTIEVIAGGTTGRPTLAINGSANSVTISWPSSFTTFTLRGQTNWNGNWSPVPGVVNNSVTVPVDPANNVVVFQLFQQ